MNAQIEVVLSGNTLILREEGDGFVVALGSNPGATYQMTKEAALLLANWILDFQGVPAELPPEEKDWRLSWEEDDMDDDEFIPCKGCSVTSEIACDQAEEDNTCPQIKAQREFTSRKTWVRCPSATCGARTKEECHAQLDSCDIPF